MADKAALEVAVQRSVVTAARIDELDYLHSELVVLKVQVRNELSTGRGERVDTAACGIQAAIDTVTARLKQLKAGGA
jgi:hypothetical protein